VVDDALLLRKLSELDDYRRQVKEFEALTVDQYARDWKIQRIIERTLQMMIETCVDVAGHIVSDEGFRIPKSYADTFTVLHENGILDDRLYLSLKKMAQFRNIVVHQYDKIDSTIVVGILQKNIKDFAAYRDAIIAHIKSRTFPDEKP
jgi:uncharacterized protein YutE (UPF0331/DUF86 family)